MPGLHSELSYQRPYPARFATNAQSFATFAVRAARRTRLRRLPKASQSEQFRQLLLLIMRADAIVADSAGIDSPLPDSLLHEDRPHEPELFGQDQLERHAVTLAGLYRLAPDPVRGRAAPPASRRERAGARRRVPVPVDGRHEGRARGRLGRLAARQPPRRAGSGARDPAGPAAQVLSGAAQAGRRAVGWLSARLRVRARAHRPHRRPPRSADARRLRDRVPAGGAADHRRDLGHPDHAAPRRWSKSCAGWPPMSSRRAAAAIARAPGACS